MCNAMYLNMDMNVNVNEHCSAVIYFELSGAIV